MRCSRAVEHLRHRVEHALRLLRAINAQVETTLRVVVDERENRFPVRGHTLFYDLHRVRTIFRDPLTLFRSNPLLFRNSPLFEILIFMLDRTLVASRAYHNALLLRNPIIYSSYSGMAVSALPINESMRPPGAKDAAQVRGPTAAEISTRLQTLVKDRDDVTRTLLHLQTATAIQMLLECCDTHLPGFSSSEEQNDNQVDNISSLNFLRISNKTIFLLKDQDGLSTVHEIRPLVCCFIHRLFVADSYLIKLLHFQVYPFYFSVISLCHL